MGSTVGLSTFEEAYEQGWAGWVIGEPQPEIVALERAGQIRGAVLDAGCGTGEHAIHLARLGYDVVGVDFSERAVALARDNAAQQHVQVRFEVADALRLAGPPRYDTIVDSALFHVFGPDDQVKYAAAVHEASRAEAVIHVLALAETDEPGFGPRISEEAIRDAFATGWELTELRSSRYRAIAGAEHADELGVAAGSAVDLPAWLATARRV